MRHPGSAYVTTGVSRSVGLKCAPFFAKLAVSYLNKRHVPVTRRAEDYIAHILERLADVIDVVHADGDVTELSAQRKRKRFFSHQLAQQSTYNWIVKIRCCSTGRSAGPSSPVITSNLSTRKSLEMSLKWDDLNVAKLGLNCSLTSSSPSLKHEKR